VAQHISRKELKQDRIKESLMHGVEEVASHQRQLWYLGAAALFFLLAFFGWRYWSDRQNTLASAALEDAMRTFHARLRAANEPADPAEITYVEEKNKYTDAARKFEEVAGKFSLTRAGRTAKYYAGLSYVALGQDENAQKWFHELDGGSDAELAALARLQLAGLYARLGKQDDAVRLYKALIDRPSTMVPRQISMLALADLYSASNPAEAEKLYNQLKTEFRGTGVADQAEERLAELKSKS
jgi:predicted negative regulator of RcsB-dependent stress response